MRIVVTGAAGAIGRYVVADLVESDLRLHDAVWLEPTPGHTPGHHSVRISSGGLDAVVTGDMVHHPIQFHHPDWSSEPDVDKPMAIEIGRAHV